MLKTTIEHCLSPSHEIEYYYRASIAKPILGFDCTFCLGVFVHVSRRYNHYVPCSSELTSLDKILEKTGSMTDPNMPTTGTRTQITNLRVN